MPGRLTALMVHITAATGGIIYLGVADSTGIFSHMLIELFNDAVGFISASSPVAIAGRVAGFATIERPEHCRVPLQAPPSIQ